MRDWLTPVGFNQWLDFVRLCPSSSPELSPLILSFNTPTAGHIRRSRYHYSGLVLSGDLLEQLSARQTRG